MNREQRRKMGGKLFPDDKGPVNLVMANKDDQVVIEFGVQLRWFSMGITDAENFIEKLQTHVNQLKVDALSATRKEKI